jgi:hypothetical protein
MEFDMSSDFPDAGTADPFRARRRFVQGQALGGVVAGLGLWPRASWALKGPGNPEVLAAPTSTSSSARRR